MSEGPGKKDVRASGVPLPDSLDSALPGSGVPLPESLDAYEETAPVDGPAGKLPGASAGENAPVEAERRRTRVLRAKAGDELQAGFRYLLEVELGGGGFGAVFLARCLDAKSGKADSPPQTVAIKVFNSPVGIDPKNLLKRELSALLALRHNRIPRVYDWNLEGHVERLDMPVAFVVFDYFPEGSLQDELRVRGPLDVAAAWRLLTDLVSALVAAHRAAILHLDVKPANVLLDGKGGYMLTDFGISQGHLVSRSVVPLGLGAPAFQAPEQRTMDSDAFDARTDLWGVGITVWTAYTGEKPLHRPDIPQGGHSNRDFYGLPMVSKLRPECPPELEEIIMSLLAIRPADRPSSAAQVLARTQAVLSGQDPDVITDAMLLRRVRIDDAEAAQLVDSLMDPLWVSICTGKGFDRYFVKFSDGEFLCREGEKSYHTFVLLSGRVRVERGDKLIAVESREGTFLGEVTTLVGRTRTASLRAEGTVWTCLFNAAELERFVTANPAIGIRLIKSLAERLSRESGTREQSEVSQQE